MSIFAAVHGIPGGVDPQWYPQQPIERLTLDQQFRLVEIAHETTDSGLRRVALRLVEQATHPAFAVSLGVLGTPQEARDDPTVGFP